MLRRQMITRADEERRRLKERQKEYDYTDQLKLAQQDKVLRANAASDERVENKRVIRR